MCAATKADYDRLDVAALLGSATQRSSSFAGILGSKSRELVDTGDADGATLLAVLSDVCSYGLRPADRREPFGPLGRGNGWRTPTPEDLDDGQLGLLIDLYEGISVAELRARVADVLFVRRRHQNFGLTAINAYLESADALLTPEDWAEASHRLERALTISLSVKSERDRVATKIYTELQNRRGDPSYFTAKMMEALLDAGLGDPGAMEPLANEAAAKGTADRDWDRAREYLLLHAQWCRKLGRGDDEAKARLQAAETYVKLADDATSRSLEASFLERAIQSLRTLAGTQARVEALHERLVTAEREAPQEFKQYSSSVDLGEGPAKARAHVSGVRLDEAIVRLSCLAWPPPTTKLREGVIAAAQKAVFYNAVPKVMVNAQGKVIGKRGSLLMGTDEQKAEALRHAMFDHARELREYLAVSAIGPARAQIAEEHFVGIRELLPLTTTSAFVPAGREEVFALGLAAGLNGDDAVALHVLMPQFEHAVRSILERSGTITSKIDEDGIQDERDLGWLLYSGDAKKMFGDDLLFEMQGLLVERFGGNLRNKMAHGLLDVAEMVGPQSTYFWWLTLHLVVRPLLGIDEAVTASSTPENATPEEAPSGTSNPSP
jgi:hypothetical protein